MPQSMAYERRLTTELFVSDGMIPDTGDVDRLTRILGRPLRAYRVVPGSLPRSRGAVKA